MRTTTQFQNLASRFLLKAAANLLLAVGFLLSALNGRGQGTITFDGPPHPEPGGPGSWATEYVESNMQFTGQVYRFSGPYFAFPYNGTAYLHTPFQHPIAFGFLDGSSFDMHSVDLAEFGLTVTNTVVPFYGYRADGSVVFTSFTTDGITDAYGPLVDFQTFYFGPEFKGLTRVEIPGVDSGYSLDNLVFSNVVPEPGTGTLVIVAAALFGLRRFRRRRRPTGAVWTCVSGNSTSTTMLRGRVPTISQKLSRGHYRLHRDQLLRKGR